MHSIPQLFDPAVELEVYDGTAANAEAATFTLLSSLRQQVSTAYSTYAASTASSDLSSIVGDLDGQDAKALKSNYPKLRSGVKKDIGASILKRSKKCCLCWHAAAGQLDHHLPKQVFPEYSVLTLNLVPVCADCNYAKSNTYRRGDGGPSFLHAYRDQLPQNDQFLLADIVVAETVLAEYRVVSTATMADSLFATLESHFDALNLADVYGNLATELMIEKLTPIYEDYDSGGAAAVRKYLIKEARGVVRQHGRNHWKPVLLRALADDDPFCNGGFAALGDRDESVFE